MDMDEVIDSVGSFGKFQYRVIVLIGLISALSSALLYATIFIAAEPDLICSKELKFNTLYNTSHTFNVTIEDEEIDHCKQWSNIMKSNNSKFIKTDNNFLLTSQDENYTYKCYFDKTYYDRTIINDWNLVCDRNYKASLTQTIHIFGSIFGFCGGILGDKLGRRRSVLIFFVLLTLTLIISQFLLFDFINLTNDIKYIIYSISQFMIGLLVNCLYCTAYVLLFEFSTEKYRTIISNLNSYIYVIGELIALVVYYFSRDWHILNWFIAFYSLVLLIITYFFLPESPLWLLSSSKHDAFSKAIAILKKMAKTNGKKNYQLPKSVIEEFKQKERLLRDSSDASSSNTKKLSLNDNVNTNLENSPVHTQTNNHKQKLNGENNNLLINDDLEISKSSENDESLNDLEGNDNNDDETENDFDLTVLKQIFVPKKNLIKTLLLFFIWISLMLIYYGISLGVTSIDHVNPYLMYFLSSKAEIIGYIACYINDIIGRKKTITAFLFISALMYAFIAIFTEYIGGDGSDPYSFKAILLMIFALVGKCAVSGSYNIAYIYTSELYPTSTRNTALLFLICFGGTSSLVAPQINLLKSLVWNPLPYIIYSVFALLSCFCVYCLPETHHHHEEISSSKIKD